MAANKNAKKQQKSKPIERSEEKTKLISLSTISTFLIGKSKFFLKHPKLKVSWDFLKYCTLLQDPINSDQLNPECRSF